MTVGDGVTLVKDGRVVKCGEAVVRFVMSLVSCVMAVVIVRCVMAAVWIVV